jgi:ribosomal protein L32
MRQTFEMMAPRYHQPQLALAGGMQQLMPDTSEWQEGSIWFAVPKRKHTPSRKRKKTTVQKRIPLKENIIFDYRTGEVTLKHMLPFNWKDYLPKIG